MRTLKKVRVVKQCLFKWMLPPLCVSGETFPSRLLPVFRGLMSWLSELPLLFSLSRARISKQFSTLAAPVTGYPAKSAESATCEPPRGANTCRIYS